MLFLIQKEFKQIRRNKFLPRIIIAFPIMILLIMPFAMNLSINNINLAFFDNDKSTLSKSLSHKISASKYFHINLYANNLNEANACINLGKCDIILEIPLHFERDLKKQNIAFVGIYANSVDAIKGGLGSNYLGAIIGDFAKDVLTIKADSFIKSIFYFNANLNYKIYMIPALMVMVLTLICGFLPAFNIVLEKENGNSDQINVSPISRGIYIIAKLIPYWIIGFIVLNICLLLAFVIYGIAPIGSLILIYLFAFVYIFVVTGLGLVISNYSQTMQQAMFVAYFFLIILILMSGIFTSTKSMPNWALFISNLDPLTYFIRAIRAIYLKGSGFDILYLDFIKLCIFGIFLNIWAILGYKKI